MKTIHFHTLEVNMILPKENDIFSHVGEQHVNISLGKPSFGWEEPKNFNKLQTNNKHQFFRQTTLVVCSFFRFF